MAPLTGGPRHLPSLPSVNAGPVDGDGEGGTLTLSYFTINKRGVTIYLICTNIKPAKHASMVWGPAWSLTHFISNIICIYYY